MADNVTVGNTEGGDNDYVVASDDDGTAQHQYVKVEFGADGTQTPVSSGNPLPVAGTVDLGTVDNAVLDAIAASLVTIDGILDTIKVDTEAIETAVEGTLTVGSHAVTNAGTFAVQDATVAGHVDGIEALLTTIDADTSNISSDSDTIVTSLATIAGDTTAIEAAVEGTLTVQGTVTSNLSATDNAVLDNIDADLSLRMSVHKSVDLDETEEEVKGSAGTVYGWTFTNEHTTTWAYLKFYDALAANVTVGSTAPTFIIGLPPGGGAVMPFGTTAITFSTAITIAAVTTAADAGSTGPAGIVAGTLFFI